MIRYLLMFFCLLTVEARAEKLYPFTLADQIEGTLAEVSSLIKKKLLANGYRLLGDYQPYAGVQILPITNKNIIDKINKLGFGGWAAVQRVALTVNKQQVDVTYYNPQYMAAIYQIPGQLDFVQASLQKLLGRIKDFGSKEGVEVNALVDYHYTEGMEGFDDKIEIASFQSFEAAKISIERIFMVDNGLSKVFQLDLNCEEILYGVSMPVGLSHDEKLMRIIDCHEPRSSAHMPYEFWLKGGRLFALHPRFRIASSFPDLKMFGPCSFHKTIHAPKDIIESLRGFGKKNDI